MMTTMQKQLVQSNECITALTNELAEIKHNSGAGAGGERKQEQQPRGKVPPPPVFENINPQGGGRQRKRSGNPNKDGHKCPTATWCTTAIKTAQRGRRTSIAAKLGTTCRST